MIDDNEFFRQATKLIYSSLNTQTAIMRTFRYLKKFLPIEALNLFYITDNGRKLFSMGWANENGVSYENNTVDLPDTFIDRYVSKWDDKVSDPKIFNEVKADWLWDLVAPNARNKDVSIVSLPLKLEGEELGGMTMYALGNNRYTADHTHLIGILEEPLAIALSNIIKHQELMKLKKLLEDDNRYLYQELYSIQQDEIIGSDRGLLEVMNKVRQVASLKSSVLLRGETGVGKEVIANAIHGLSHRKNEPYIKVNCGAIPESLLDSELFGHEKGAFTGAVERKRGRFERAHNGTIFLDEIGELTLQAQTRLLRVLQFKEVERLGGSESIPVNVRIIAATHRNLEKMIIEGSFREDLWFRLNVFPIDIPPLRERKTDISNLVQYFIQKKAREMNLKTIPPPKTEALDRLKNYHWPGNVRELENVVERELIQSRSWQGVYELSFEHFLQVSDHGSDSEINVESDITGEKSLSLNHHTAMHIRRVLKMCKGKIYGVGGAAEILEINPNTLRARMKKLGIPFRRSEISNF